MVNMQYRALKTLVVLAVFGFLILNARSQPSAPATPAAATNDAPSPTAPALDPARFEALFNSIKPTKAELRWMEIPWIGTLQHGRDAAVAQQKPMFLWAMNGHPLGTC